MVEKYKKHDRDFKINVVKLSYQRSSIKEYAEELGVAAKSLSKWRQEYKRFGAGSFYGSGYVIIHPEEKKTFELEKKIKRIRT